MTRVATAENEDLLLNIARYGTAYHVERFVAQYRRVEKLQEPGTAQALYEQRELACYYDADGCVVIKARIPAEQGELVVKALERAMEQQEACREEDNQEREPVSARRADALCEVAETYLNQPENAGSTADRYQVVVHVRTDAPASSAGHLENGPCVSADSVPSG